jgi:hypothetical protein
MMLGVPMSVVHEQHHNGAREKKQIRQHSEHMRSMFCEQEESGHSTKPNRSDSTGRAPEG